MCLPHFSNCFSRRWPRYLHTGKLTKLIIVFFNMCLIFWGQFEALQIMCYNWKKVFLIKTVFYYHFQLSFDNENWFFFKKELRQHSLWKSTSNRSESYFPGCAVQHERLPVFSHGFTPHGTAHGSFLWEKKESIDWAYPKANKLSFPWGKQQ